MIIPEPKKEMDQVDLFNRCLYILKSLNTCTLATALDNKPRARAMEYAVDNAAIIYMLTEGGRKVRDILLNLNVSISVWERSETPRTIRGLTITARAEVLDPGDAKRFEKYYEKYSRHIGRDVPEVDDLPMSVKLIRAVPEVIELFDQSLTGQGYSHKQVWRR